jgi:hypothetical protein
MELAAGGLAAVGFTVVGLVVCNEQVVGIVVLVVGFPVERLDIMCGLAAGRLAAVKFAVVGCVVCIEHVVGFVVVVVGIDEVMVFAVVVVVHPPNLGLIKGGFGRMGQPVNTSGGKQLTINLLLIA